MKSRFYSRFAALLLLISMFSLIPFAQAVPNQQAQFAVPIVVVNTSFLNVRSGDGPQYTVITTIVGGTELSVLGSNRNQAWFLVTTPIGAGWVDANFVLARGDFRNVPVLDVAAAGATVAYSTPLTIGLPVSISDTPIQAPLQTSLSVTGAERLRAVLQVLAVDLHAQPRLDSARLITLFQDNSADYAIVGRAFDDRYVEWVAIQVPNVGTGWIEAAKIGTRLSTATFSVVVVRGGNADLFSSPAGLRLDLPTLFEGQEAFLINVSGDGRFYEVELANGITGWLRADQVAIRSVGAGQGLAAEGALPEQTVGTGIPIPQLEAGYIIVNTSAQNIRSGPGGQYTVVTTVYGGTIFYPIGVTEDAEWYLVRGEFGQGWISSEYVLFRGTFSNIPVLRGVY